MFTGLDETLVKRPDNGVVLNDRDGWHVQGGTHDAASAGDVTLAAFAARVFGKGSQACQSADLFAAEATQFRKRDE
jgi:hypothetical protein